MAQTKTLPATESNKRMLSIFPNFDKSGSILGMKRMYYGKDALLVRCGGYIYKVTQEYYDMAN